MKLQKNCKDHVWLRVNIFLYAGYAAFGLASLFWPTPLHNPVYITLHLVTLVIYVAIVYGLVMRRFPMNYLVVFVSPFMIAHLIAFTLSPLGMELAYLGPSRSFYSFYLTVFASLLNENALIYSIIVFNVISMIIHAINFCYFMRKKTARLFTTRSES